MMYVFITFITFYIIINYLFFTPLGYFIRSVYTTVFYIFY